MKRVELTEAVLLGWARLNAAQRERFFAAFVRAAVRLDQLALRAWLRKRLRNPPLAAPVDLTRFAISDADMALLLKQLGGISGPGCRKPNPETFGICSSHTSARDPLVGERHRVTIASRRASRHHRDTVQAINDGMSAFEAKALSPSPGAFITHRAVCTFTDKPIRGFSRASAPCLSHCRLEARKVR